MTEAQKLEVYKSTPEYIAYQEALAEWYAQQQKIAELSQADMTEAQKLEVYKSTPEYIAYQEALTEWQAQQEANSNPFAGLSGGSGVGTQQSGATKVFAMPVQQEPNPPDKHSDGFSSWWDVFDLDWWKSDEPWPWESPQPVTTPIPLPTAQVFITPGALFTPTPTSTLVLPNFQIYKSTGPLTNWELTVGGQVAHNAHLLLQQANNFYFWSNDDPGTNSDPPRSIIYNPNLPISLNPNDYNIPWYGENNILQYTGGRIPFVCGDIPDHAYLKAGYNLQQLIFLPNPYNPSEPLYPNHWPSSSYGYLSMLYQQGNHNVYTVNANGNFGVLPELGDVIVTQTDSNPFTTFDLKTGESPATHVVVVAEVHGNTPSQIFIIDGNASHGTLEKYTVQELIDRNPDFQYLIYGHPNLPAGTQ